MFDFEWCSIGRPGFMQRRNSFPQHDRENGECKQSSGCLFLVLFLRRDVLKCFVHVSVGNGLRKHLVMSCLLLHGALVLHEETGKEI